MGQGYQKKINSAGQTLIETLAAVFILAMGMTAAVGLAIYAFNTSGGVVKQIIATGLAREGLEAVRNMRDTNWLKDTLKTNCYNFNSNPVGQANANCYENWIGKSGLTYYCLDPSNGGGQSCNGHLSSLDYYLGINSATKEFWIFDNASANYGINLDKINFGTGGFYTEDGNTSCLNATSDYCRSINVQKLDSNAPYNQNTGPLILVKSRVWWVDKKCPRVQIYDNAPISCRLELDTYLTNWKNF